VDWADVLKDETLRDLPYKVELNEWGKIVLSPAGNRHGMLQAELAWRLREEIGEGGIVVECSIRTAKGVKVADVAWGSRAFFRRNGEATPYEEAPELCVEIVSPSNSTREMEEKAALYFSSGAKEVWICKEDGELEFRDEGGRLEASALFPGTPCRVPLQEAFWV